jgi:hypothetical protein
VDVHAKLKGGLANQMFIAAAGMALSSRLGCGLVLDASNYSNSNEVRELEIEVFQELKSCIKFETPSVLGRFAKLNKKFNPRSVHKASNVFLENGFSYDDRFTEIQEPVFLDGYFQSLRYFVDVENKVQDVFQDPTENPVQIQIASEVGNNFNAIHVRRGDYMNPLTSAFHGVCDSSYFMRGLETIEKITGENMPVVCFTDSPKEISDDLKRKIDFIVDPEVGRSYHHMFAMRSAKHLVMSNSSFSWWAAYLGNREDRVVIAPRPWFQQGDTSASDLILPNWLSLGARNWTSAGD